MTSVESSVELQSRGLATKPQMTLKVPLTRQSEAVLSAGYTLAALEAGGLRMVRGQ